MPIPVTCPACGTRMRAPDNAAGKSAECRRCKTSFVIAPVGADVAPESVGQIAQLPQPFHPHWAWVSDLVLQRTALIDLDDSRFLGMINGGFGPITPLFPTRRAEIYVANTYYSRFSHGERTDVLEIYDAKSLALSGEVVVPRVVSRRRSSPAPPSKRPC